MCVSLSVGPTLCDAMDSVHVPLSVGFSWQEYWGGLPFPSPEDLPNPGIKFRFPVLYVDSLPSEPSGKIYVQNRNRLTDRENKLVITKRQRGLGKGKLGVSVQFSRSVVSDSL